MTRRHDLRAGERRWRYTRDRQRAARPSVVGGSVLATIATFIADYWQGLLFFVGLLIGKSL